MKAKFLEVFETVNVVYSSCVILHTHEENLYPLNAFPWAV